MIIGELSERSGVSPRSLRHYEKLGLIAPVRADNGYRHYGDAAVQVVSTIHAMFELGFTSDDVRAVLPCATGEKPHGDAELVDRVREMQQRVGARLRTLAETEQALGEFLRANAAD